MKIFFPDVVARAAVVGLVASVFAGLALAQVPTPVEAPKLPTRPFRLGMMRMAPELDRTKALAVSDLPGWAVVGGHLIGAFDKRWVGAKSMADGKVGWWLSGDTDLTAPPTVVGSWVVLGYRSGNIAKVEAVTGKKIWEVTLDSLTERRVVLVGANLLVLTAGQVLYALDFQTGKTVWLYDAGFPEGLNIRGGVLPMAHDDKVILGIASGEVLAVNQTSGKLLWRYNPAFNDSRFHDVVGEMVIRNSQLLISRYDGLVAAIDLASAERKIIWQNQLPSVATSAFRNGRYYVGTVNGDLFAYDASNGRQIWRAEIGPAIGSITPGESIIYVVGSNGRLTGVETATGGIVWADDVAGEVASAPFIYNDGLYVETGLKNIYGYKLY